MSKNKQKNQHKFKALIYHSINESLKNYNQVDSSRVFFPGCSFMSYFPEATRRISSTLKNEFGISTVYDCCTKNVALLKEKSEFISCMDNLHSRFYTHQIKEVIVLCPNCYNHLSHLKDIKVSMIYEHNDLMEALIIPSQKELIQGYLFVPCPDKSKRTIYNSIKKYINIENLTELNKIYCCGAGLRVKTQKVIDKINHQFASCTEPIYVYCASCRGVIFKSNQEVHHILCTLMGVDEIITPGFSSFKNRLAFRFSK